MIGDAPNGKSQLKEFTSEENGKSIKFLDQVQPMQVTFSEAGRWEGSLKRLILTLGKTYMIFFSSLFSNPGRQDRTRSCTKILLRWEP